MRTTTENWSFKMFRSLTLKTQSSYHPGNGYEVLYAAMPSGEAQKAGAALARTKPQMYSLLALWCVSSLA